CMTADAVQTLDPGVHLDRFPEELDILLPLQQTPSERSVRLISHKEDRTFRSPQIVFQMMADPPRVAHSGSRYDDLRLLDKIDHLRVFTRGGCVKSRKDKRVHPCVYKGQCLFIKTVPHIFRKDLRRLDRKRAVQVHLEILVFWKQPFLLDLSDEIQHLLSPADRERRNDYISSPVKGLADDPGKLSEIIRLLRRMDPVSVGGLY